MKYTLKAGAPKRGAGFVPMDDEERMMGRPATREIALDVEIAIESRACDAGEFKAALREGLNREIPRLFSRLIKPVARRRLAAAHRRSIPTHMVLPPMDVSPDEK